MSVPAGAPFIRPRSRGTSSSADALLHAEGLDPEQAREAGRRLELASLAVAAAFIFATATNALLRTVGWQAMPRPVAHAVVAAVVVAVSLIVARAARSGAVGPARLVRLALRYEVMVAFGIAMGDNLAPLGEERPLESVSWLCVWIVMFPLVVPAPPRRAAVASVAAASTWPLAFFIGVSLGNPAPALPVVVLNFLEPYLAAALALVPSLILRRLAAAVQRAREMGSYELVERLDRGGMGEVWRARHRMLARPAAVKLIRADRLGLGSGRVAESLIRRFEREAQATAALQSPHSIELYDFGVTREGTFYYVMEILDGLDLESLVARFGPLAPERVVHLVLQACDSLADAHHRGLVHRDVKPANLYVCRRGLRHDFLKVLDFGLVKAAWIDDGADASLTGDGAVAGTPAYMAPEVARGETAIDARVDLYGLGCVAYWLLTGHRVFEGATPLQVALQHAQAAPVPPSRRSELAVPPELEAVVMACLEKDPARRPCSAVDVAERLAASGLAALWSEERARRWWEAHLPRAAEAAVISS